MCASRLNRVVLRSGLIAKSRTNADAANQADTMARNTSKDPFLPSSLLVPSLYCQFPWQRQIASGDLEPIAFLHNASSFLLLPCMESSSGTLSDIYRRMLAAWFAIFDQVLHSNINGSSSDVPVRAALFCMDAVPASDRPKLLVRIDLGSSSDDADGIVRPKVVLVSEDDPMLPGLMDTAAAAASSHTSAMDVDHDSVGGDALVSSSIASETTTQYVDRSRTPSYASLGGLRVDSSVSPLFTHAIAMDDMHTWNDYVTKRPDFCTILINTIKFALSPQVLSELCKESVDLTGDLELRILSVYSKLIGGGGISFPGRPASRPSHITEGIRGAVQFPMEYNKAVCSIMNAIGFDSRKPPM
jgi:hypothetical protein